MEQKHINFEFNKYGYAYSTTEGRIAIAFHIPNVLARISDYMTGYLDYIAADHPELKEGVKYFETNYHRQSGFTEPVLNLAAYHFPGIMDSTENNKAEDEASRGKYVIPYEILNGVDISDMSGLTLSAGTYVENGTEYSFSAKSITVRVSGDTYTGENAGRKGVKVEDIYFDLLMDVEENTPEPEITYGLDVISQFSTIDANGETLLWGSAITYYDGVEYSRSDINPSCAITWTIADPNPGVAIIEKTRYGDVLLRGYNVTIFDKTVVVKGEYNGNSALTQEITVLGAESHTYNVSFGDNTWEFTTSAVTGKQAYASFDNEDVTNSANWSIDSRQDAGNCTVNNTNNKGFITINTAITGTTDIIADYGGYSDYVRIVVIEQGGGGDEPGPSDVITYELFVGDASDEKEIEIIENDEEQLYASLVKYVNGNFVESGSVVTSYCDWSSNDTSVASVNNNSGNKGKVTGNGAGEAIITARYTASTPSDGTIVVDSDSATATVLSHTFVILPATSTLSSNNTSVTYTAYYDGDEIDNSECSWGLIAGDGTGYVSIDEGVVTLDTVPSDSDKSVTVRAGYGQMSDTAEITIKKETISRIITAITITCTPTSLEIPAGGGSVNMSNVEYTVTGYYNDGTNEDITDWQSVSVSSNTVSRSSRENIIGAAIACEDLVLGATYGQLTDTCNVTVTQKENQLVATGAPSYDTEITSGKTDVGTNSYYTIDVDPDTASIGSNGGDINVTVTGAKITTETGNTVSTYETITTPWSAYTSDPNYHYEGTPEREPHSSSEPYHTESSETAATEFYSSTTPIGYSVTKDNDTGYTIDVDSYMGTTDRTFTAVFRVVANTAVTGSTVVTQTGGSGPGPSQKRTIQIVASYTNFPIYFGGGVSLGLNSGSFELSKDDGTGKIRYEGNYNGTNNTSWSPTNYNLIEFETTNFGSFTANFDMTIPDRPGPLIVSGAGNFSDLQNATFTSEVVSIGIDIPAHSSSDVVYINYSGNDSLTIKLG